jgi:hypothetical protein
MTAVYTNARVLMSVEATSLAAEATTAGLTSLATALTNLATEITTNNGDGGATDADFYGGSGNSGLFQIYNQTLISAASIIRSHIANTVAGYTNTIQTKLTSIDSTLSNIKTDLDTISTNISGINTSMSGIKTDMDGIKTDMDGIKTDLDTMSSNSTAIKNLAQGTGIHMVGPYDWLGFASIYHLYVEQGKLLDQSGNASPDQQAAALTQLESYLTKVQNLPTLF